ncbi:sensor histidine kinase [Desulfotruncus alcoholivorax]|uniref:sensor histidine kinase n=1 Tax=Desulfotruncus alcoholivorax TaxID=265477 RepID=UPI00042388A8|nr:HAMP domain-containing sensor histidine kinase [Desulfotruncus alcoholivorax]
MRSVTWRLTIWYAAILLAILFICGAAALGVMRYLLYTEASREVEMAVAKVQDLTDTEVANNNYDESYEHMDLNDPELTSSADYGILWVQITTRKGRVLNSSRALGKNILPSDYIGPPGTAVFHGKKILMAGAILSDNALVQVAKPLDREVGFLKTLAGVLGLLAMCGMVLTITGGRLITRAALRPVHSITQTARQISTTDLSRRIDLHSPRDELYTLTETFNQMLDRLEQGFHRQQEFVTAASHDLRTPLTVIKNYSDLLNRWGKNDPSIVNESVQAITKAVGTMERLVNELLLLARLQTKPPLVARPVSLIELAEEAVQEAKAIAKNLTIEFGHVESAMVAADEHYLRRVLWILIDNAIKYNRPGGKITVNVATEKEKKKAVLSVIDTGQGIAEGDLSRIFDRFYRGDPARSQSKGFGLGLAIAKEIVEAHGGMITVKSRLDYGSIFTIVLPLA